MSEDIRIKAAERLAKCDGMEGSPWALLVSHGICKVREVRSGEYVEELDYSDQYSWLKIEDHNYWSSAAILYRSGVPFSKLLRECPFVNSAFLCGMVEVAYIFAVCKLYEIDRPAYDKAIDPTRSKPQSS